MGMFLLILLVGDDGMKALVTGASGMLGCHLVSRLIRDGWEVVSLIRPGSLSRRPWAKDVLRGTSIVPADLTVGKKLAEALRGHRGFNAVFHLAAVVSARGSKTYSVNYGGTKNLMCILRGMDVGVLVYTSSILALGDTLRDRADEEAPCKPRTSYEKSKCDSERLVLRLASERGFRAVIVRPTWMYGEYTRNPDIPRLLSLARRGLVPVLVSDNHPVSLVYAGDVAEAMARLASTSVSGIFNVRGPRTYTSLELAERLAEAVGRRRYAKITVPRLALSLSARLMDITRLLLLASSSIPIDRLIGEAGFKPTVDLGEGLRGTAEWLFSGKR